MTESTCERCGQVHPRCKAHNNTGAPCGKWPTKGAVVCRNHGASAPQVKAKAEERLAALVDPVIDRFSKIIQDEKADDSDVIRLGRDILDRTGLQTVQRHEVVVTDPNLAARLDRLVAEKQALAGEAKSA